MSHSEYSKCPSLARMHYYGDACATGLWPGIVNNALLHSSPIVNHSLPQIVHILHFCLLDSLLHYAPDFIFNWIEVGAIG